MSRPPGASFDPSEGERHPHRWGYTDTAFAWDDAEPGAVRVTGSRYPLCGYAMPYFLPFLEEVLGVPVRREDVRPEREREALAPPVESAPFLSALEGVLRPDQVSDDEGDRLAHSHGQLSVDEVYRVLYEAPVERPVDLVLRPETDDQVRALVALARAHDVVLVPYGGGTNVSGALAVSPGLRRPVASVDMRRMDAVRWLDEENLLACVEAGITGKALEKVLNARGFTAGHEPDSMELSTLGGWIATNASGMKKNRYGNIEDIVVEAAVVTPAGEIATRRAAPRTSTGPTPRSLVFGSEGTLGIVTSAVLRVHRLPEVQRYGSLVFPSFEQGVAYLRALRGTGRLPASIRLVNNREFRFGQALRPRRSGWKALKHRAQHLLLHRVKGFDLERMAACTIVMEGSHEEVRLQSRTVFRLARRFGGLSGGAVNGRRGYMLTFGIAYIRDFLSGLGILGETFETSVPWSRIHEMTAAVGRTLEERARAHGLAGRPFLSYRVTQTYHTGVCVYFTLGFSGRGLPRAVAVFDEIEHALRQAILDHGGSLSHHHGVGKIRQGFLDQVHGEGTLEVLRKVKEAVDPTDVFAIGNGPFGHDGSPSDAHPDPG